MAQNGTICRNLTESPNLSLAALGARFLARLELFADDTKSAPTSSIIHYWARSKTIRALGAADRRMNNPAKGLRSKKNGKIVLVVNRFAGIGGWQSPAL